MRRVGGAAAGAAGSRGGFVMGAVHGLNNRGERIGADERWFADPQRYSPHGTPRCHFEAGSLYCVNDPCANPNHRRPADSDVRR